MLSLQTSISFATLAFVMALSPGPNLLYLASRSVCQGSAAGFASLAGVCTAMLCYMLAAAAGLSVLFAAAPLAYEIVRVVGVAYLLWLAFKAFRSKPAPLGSRALAPEPYAALFRQGFTTCLLNPKIVLMYGSLLPQFVHPDAGSPLAQTLALGLVQIGAAALAHTGVILSASRVSRLMQRSSRLIRGQRYLLSGLLAGVALRVAMDARRGG